ncbi:MAG: bifunctional precorrin-2 dehydrogenase/sirohydrochlorin ferrochelatase [Deltaproteobacteria bacterium]|nr:bifunctional precorrin-2 dehydrogenase/sirohydrochlorin ferrochelatase [Deltaproteobacteria bacterium]
MRYYPVNLDIKNRHCLVVGGGHVGERKVKTLLECGAKVSVVSPQVTQYIKDLASRALVELKTRNYRTSDLEGKFLVIGTTEDQVINQRLSEDAFNCGTLCNIADQPAACTFVLPAIVRQGDLTIAISTSNKSPAMAKRIRKKLENEFGPEYAKLLNIMGAIRYKLLAEANKPETNKEKFEKLLDAGLLEMVRQDRTENIDAKLKEVLGEEYNLQSLMEVEQLQDNDGSTSLRG